MKQIKAERGQKTPIGNRTLLTAVFAKQLFRFSICDTTVASAAVTYAHPALRFAWHLTLLYTNLQRHCSGLLIQLFSEPSLRMAFAGQSLPPVMLCQHGLLRNPRGGTVRHQETVLGAGPGALAAVSAAWSKPKHIACASTVILRAWHQQKFHGSRRWHLCAKAKCGTCRRRQMAFPWTFLCGWPSVGHEVPVPREAANLHAERSQCHTKMGQWLFDWAKADVCATRTESVQLSDASTSVQAPNSDQVLL